MRISPTITKSILDGLTPIHPKAVYVFGSFGTQHERPDSDIDIAILPEQPEPTTNLFRIANMLSVSLRREVDLIDLSTASTVMAKEVLRTGQRLDVSDLAATQEFEMRTLSDYARLNEERQPIIAG